MRIQSVVGIVRGSGKGSSSATGERFVLIQNHRMEGLSRAYVDTIASAAGLNISHSRWDYGIDLTLSEVYCSPEGRYFDVGPRIDIQLKSTTLADHLPKGIRYALEAKTYNDLVFPWVQRQVLLVVVVLPVSEDDWIRQTESGLTMNGCGYWLSLRGRKATRNKRAITVTIPRENVFSVAVLKNLFQQASKGESP